MYLEGSLPAPRKPKYICKADRLKMEAEAAGDTANVADS